MLCALSGQAVVDPVVSPVSGKVFEKSTIEAWIAEKGTDPVTGKELSSDQLISLDLRPANPELVKSASIPGLLKALQTEFNAIVLENHELLEQVKETRREFDAALRVITRLRAASESAAAIKRRPSNYQLDANETEQSSSSSTTSSLSNQAPPPAKRSKPEEYPSSSAAVEEANLPTLQESMESFLHDVAATKRFLQLKRKNFNKYNNEIRTADENVTLRFLRPKSSKTFGFPPKLKVLGNRAITGSYLVDLESETETKLPGTCYIVNESTLCLAQTRKLQLLNLSLDPIENAHVAINEKVLDAIPHPSGYLLTRRANSIDVYELFDFKFLKKITVPKCTGLAIHPDGDLIFTSSQQNPGVITAHSFSKILAEDEDGSVMDEIDAATSSPDPSKKAPVITLLECSNNGFSVAFVLDNNTVGIADLRYAEKPQWFTGIGQARAPVKGLSFDHSGSRLLAASGTNGAVLFTYDGEKWIQKPLTESRVAAIDWHNDEAIAITN